jgi:formamidopyrimidine-DNA glycosylase
MPELPEVEIAARNLRRWALGHRITSVALDPRGKRLYRPGTAAAFARAVDGATLTGLRRIGKHLLLTLERGGAPVGVHAHLGMTGKWVRREGSDAAPSHARASLALDDGGVLHYQDARLFGRLRLVPEARFAALKELAALGPDPLEQGIDEAKLAAAMARSRLPVKVRLLDQSVLPGVGNIHASEACFRAKVDPRRKANDLSRAEVKRLAACVMDSFRMTLEKEDGPEVIYVEEPGAANPFLVYGREGERCPRCRKADLVRIVQAQRSTFYCPRCQR